MPPYTFYDLSIFHCLCQMLSDPPPWLASGHGFVSWNLAIGTGHLTQLSFQKKLLPVLPSYSWPTLDTLSRSNRGQECGLSTFLFCWNFLTWILFPFNVWRSWKLIKRKKRNYGFFWRIRIRIKLADITGHLVLFSPFNIDQNKVGLFQAWMSVFNGSPSPRLLPIHSMATLPAML